MKHIAYPFFYVYEFLRNLSPKGCHFVLVCQNLKKKKKIPYIYGNAERSENMTFPLDDLKKTSTGRTGTAPKKEHKYALSDRAIYPGHPQHP